jgi:hypothetical protein
VATTMARGDVCGNYDGPWRCLWASAGAVDNTLYLYAHAGLWKVEDFLYRAAIATTRSIEMQL